MKIRKLLIANRGEIAVRIIKTCRKLGIKTVAVYSDADVNALHVKLADEAFHIGRSPPPFSYLNIEKICEVVKRSGADAVHPGYGFLAENAAFAEAVEKLGVVWVGPPAKVMKRIESKCYCRRVAREAGVPTIPGSLEPVDKEKAEKYLEEFGCILVKADLGGGGKGMKIIRSRDELERFFESAQREASIAFGRPYVYVEKVLERPRHIEVQILADKYGNVVSLGERECSIQRRYQKIIEESPSPVVDEKTRQYISELAIKLMEKIGYENAGTVEFLRDQNGNFYFLEINKRIQVEHTITECVTGVDIVEQQLRIASGEPLELRSVTKLSGHSMECRIYAEDPTTFLPSPGKILRVKLPEGEGIRVDHALEDGTYIPPFYDPLIAKVIVHTQNREASIGLMMKALQDFEVEGIKTSIPFLLRILNNEEFVKGDIHTQLVDQLLQGATEVKA
jgi:acetyl-CoA carboxylase biotin carboxylase subunit